MQGAAGNYLPYKGYIETQVSVPFLSNRVLDVPILVVSDTDYNLQVPVIIGTNIIDRCKSACASNHVSVEEIPPVWQRGFDSLIDEGIPVKTTNSYSIRIGPNEVKTIHGIARKSGDFDTAITEHVDTSLSGNLNICPRVVSLKSTGTTVRVPVRVCNLSAYAVEIPPKSVFCTLNSVKVVDSWTPASSQKSDEESTNDIDLEQLGVSIDTNNLSPDQFQRVKQVLGSWSTIFSKGSTDLGKANIVKHGIKLSDNTPFKEPYRRIPPAMYEEVRQHLKEMLEADAIRPSESPYSSNVVLVRKKDGSLRFCIDFRKLNARTIRDAYSLPRIDDTIDTLIGAKYFSKLDLRSGYWQVEMEEADKEKTAFTVGSLGFFECNRMAFGLTNAPATFQRLMERCMGELNLKECLIFLDDILIFSDTFEEHIKRLNAVFSRLHEHGLKLKPSKCEFFKSRVTYLGHVVSSEGVETDPEKIRALSDWPEPHNIKTLRSFLGFTGYYRRFIKDYAKIVKPLNDLLVGHPTNKHAVAEMKKKKKKASPWHWGVSEQNAFDTLKAKLSSPPVLAYANFSKPFIVHTDASTEGLGAVLYQEHDGIEKVIAYASRGLRASERNYPAHKLEFLCLKWAVTDKFHDYLYGNQFEVCTDNNPLTYVLTSAKLDATGHRWLAALNTYNFSLKYKSGKLNGDADGLSRRPHEEVTLLPDAVQAICLAYTVNRTSCPYAETLVVTSAPQLVGSIDPTAQHEPEGTELSSVDWVQEQGKDACIAKVINFVQNDHWPSNDELDPEQPDVRKYLRHWNNYVLENGILYRNTVLNGEPVKQLVLPLHYRETVLKQLHDNVGHQGQDRTMYLVRSRFFWPGFDKDVEQKVRNCISCITRKTYPKPSAELINIQSTQPMELVCIDFLSLERSKGGYENILVITDHFKRYAQAFPTRNQTASTTAKVLFENFIVHYGFPGRIHSDQGRIFESSLIKELCKLAGVQKSRTTPYHPMGNGMVERFNQTLLNMLGTLEDGQKADWKSYVAPMVHSYNATRHESTGYSPYFLMFGRHPRLAVDAYLGLSSEDEPIASKEHYATKLKKRLQFAYKTASREAEKSAARHKDIYDSKVRESTLDIGDRVLVRNVGLKGKCKLANKWARHPYVVVDQPDKSIPVYKVSKESGKGKERTLHRNMLLPFSAIPISSEIDETLLSNRKPRQARETRKADTRSESSVSEEESSESEAEIFVPLQIPKSQKKVRQGKVKQSSHEPVHEVFVLDPSGISEIPIVSISDRNLSQPGAEISGSSTLPYYDPSSVSSVQPETNISVNPMDSSPSFEASVAPRRSGRNRKPPDRYGEWTSNQQSIVDNKVKSTIVWV